MTTTTASSSLMEICILRRVEETIWRALRAHLWLLYGPRSSTCKRDAKGNFLSIGVINFSFICPLRHVRPEAGKDFDNEFRSEIIQLLKIFNLDCDVKIYPTKDNT